MESRQMERFRGGGDCEDEADGLIWPDDLLSLQSPSSRIRPRAGIIP